MRRIPLLFVALALLLTVLAVTLNNWSGKVGLTPNSAFWVVIAAELALFVVIIVRHRRSHG